MGIFWRRKSKDEFLTLGLNQPAAEQTQANQPASAPETAEKPATTSDHAAPPARKQQRLQGRDEPLGLPSPPPCWVSIFRSKNCRLKRRLWSRSFGALPPCSCGYSRFTLGKLDTVFQAANELTRPCLRAEEALSPPTSESRQLCRFSRMCVAHRPSANRRPGGAEAGDQKRVAADFAESEARGVASETSVPENVVLT